MLHFRCFHFAANTVVVLLILKSNTSDCILGLALDKLYQSLCGEVISLILLPSESEFVLLRVSSYSERNLKIQTAWHYKHLIGQSIS